MTRLASTGRRFGLRTALLLMAVIAGLVPLWLSPASLLWAIVPVIVLAAILWSNRAHGVVYSPVTLLAVGWLLPAMTTCFAPQWMLDGRTWMVILTSYLAFAAGYSIPVSVWLRKRKPQSRTGSVLQAWDKQRFRKALSVLFTLGMLGFGVNLANVWRHGGLPIYWHLEFREVERIFAFHPLTNYLYFLNGLVLILGTAYVSCYGGTFSVLLQMIASFAALFFHTVVGTVVFPTVIAIYAYWLLGRRFPVRMVVSLLLLAFLAFGIVSIGRRYVTPSEATPQEFVFFVARRMYRYMAPNFANLRMELTHRVNHLWGAMTVAGPIVKLVSLSGRLPFARLALPGTHLYLVDRLYNAGTYLRDFFVDFGLGGILAGPFVLGLVTTLLFGQFRFNPTLRNALLYSIAVTMITFTFWFNEFTRIQFWYFMAIIWLADRLLIKRGQAARMGMRPRRGFAPGPTVSQ